MTAITKTRSDTAPPLARAGLALPGLGHLLLGEWVKGFGMLLLMSVILHAFLTGMPRVPSMLVEGAMPSALMLPPMAMVAAGLLTPLVWMRLASSGSTMSGWRVALLGLAWLLGAISAIYDPPLVGSSPLVLFLPALVVATVAAATSADRRLATATALVWLPSLVTLALSLLVPSWRGQVFNGFDAIHGMFAIIAWPIVTAGLWYVAYRRAFPRPLTDAEFNSNQQLFLRSMTRHRTGMLGLFGVAFMILVTVLTPLIAPFDPDMVDVAEKNLAPSAAFWMGTDGFGRDVWSRMLFGGRISLSIGFVAVSIAATMGTTIGALAAFAGGFVDRLLMFLTDGLLALPRLVLLLTIVGLFRFQGVLGIFMIVAILGMTGWMGVARIVRSQVLSLKQQEFVQAAQALGLSPTRILFRHLIPNALAPVIVYCSLAIGSTMLAEAGLSFLGLGVPPPTATWGVMVADGRDALRVAPHAAIFPGIAIMLSVLSFNMLGDGLRDALDPKMRGH